MEQLSTEVELRRFLLGQLGEQERLALEERMLFEEGLAAHAAAEERDLIDAYVRGELGGEERHALEVGLLRSPAVRERLEVAQALYDHDRARHPRKGPRLGFGSTWRWLAAALVVVAVGVGWWQGRTPTIELSLLDPRSGVTLPTLTVPEGCRRFEVVVDLAPWLDQGPYRVDLEAPGSTVVTTSVEGAIDNDDEGLLRFDVRSRDPLPLGRYLIRLVPVSDSGPRPEEVVFEVLRTR